MIAAVVPLFSYLSSTIHIIHHLLSFPPCSLREPHSVAHRRPGVPDDARLVPLTTLGLLLGPAFELDE